MSPIVLVGCVKTKHEVPMAASDLYSSSLFTARRSWAQAQRGPWFILSAKHGLIDPTQTIAPYDETLRGESRSAQRLWASNVAEALSLHLHDLDKADIEIHAGGDYYRFLEPMLVERGAQVTVPLRHIVGIGSQIAWYRPRR